MDILRVIKTSVESSKFLILEYKSALVRNYTVIIQDQGQPLVNVNTTSV